METKKVPLSIRVIYWITNVSFWLSILFVFSLLVESILVYTGLKTDVGSLGRLLPVSVKIQENGNLDLNNQSTTLKLITYSEGIEIIDPPQFIVKKIVLVNLLLFLIGTYILWVFRKFLKNVKRGETFSIKNISLLKRISYVLVGSWLVHSVYSLLAYYYIKGHLIITNAQLLRSGFLYNLHVQLLWEALLLWVLAHIFITGLKLKQEKDLTI